MHEALDNPMWNALVSRHAYLAVGAGFARRYPPEVTPFIGIKDASPDSERDLLQIVSHGEKVGLLGFPRLETPDWKVLNQIDIHQFIWTVESIPPESNLDIVPMTEAHLPRMLALTELAYPAYFRPGTAKLGSYFGILEGETLCAMAGVRLSMDGYQEISAVCTHPNHRGKGYAARLTSHLVGHVQSQGDIPFLHTESDNLAAQSIYRRCGFTLRKVLPFTVMERLVVQVDLRDFQARQLN